ncbi:hypothetical protein L9F63_013950, partial [Diploptera punctata]
NSLPEDIGVVIALFIHWRSHGFKIHKDESEYCVVTNVENIKVFEIINSCLSETLPIHMVSIPFKSKTSLAVYPIHSHA